MKNLDEPLDAILARASAALDQREAAGLPDPPRPADGDLRTRRLRALTGAGWEARALRIAQSPAYEESRVASYLEALRVVDGPEGGIVVLSGQYGSGKTAATARWALGRPTPSGVRFATPRFLTATEFFRSSRYARGEDDDSPPTRDEILRSGALVLDDAGAEFADSKLNFRVDMDELVDKFYRSDRVLVITTNIAYASPAQRASIKAKGHEVDEKAETFEGRYGERVADRIRESGRWVGSSSPSMRARSR